MSQPEASSDLVVLKGCGDSAEAAMVRALLESHGIECVVQGENHRAMLGAVMGGYIEVNVLVASEDLERAQALLEASAEAPENARPASPGATDSEEAVCPVHGQRSTATCARCGTFLCEECDVQGAQGSSLCEDCAERKVAGGESRRDSRRRLAAWAVLLFLFGPVILMVLSVLLRRLMG
ncbi:DUF2007 domain-containing protein [Pyxidicoccus parkwayensis]|uniref:DUF2007 domain-containing protein n=1 Tax=Pyxidicoccus parkwayensis TaxID=2813578 RepID=A0ABX7PAK5_9BACT|nr:DUF2007 domain-containing protein [Pyxidicoccus parkwaysis]QSQ27485.1 DUF2007 domain-containing protein [Pyxidicoccus parkwaysis]